MDVADIQKLVEEIVSLWMQSSEEADKEDFGASRISSDKADALELSLRGEGYELEDDEDADLIHVLASDGTRIASFHLDEWSWKEVEMQS